MKGIAPRPNRWLLWAQVPVLAAGLLTGGAGGALGPHVAIAACTGADKADLARAGYTKREIERECAERNDDDDDRARIPQRRRGPQNYPPLNYPQLARFCQTPWGVCPMAAQVPIGASCACYMPTGSFPGIAR